MESKGTLMLTAVILGIVLQGCATTGRKSDLEVQGYKNQIQALEAQLQEKDQEAASLREALVRKTEEYAATRRMSREGVAMPEVKSHPTLKMIQLALKNAGYNPGPIDGRKGKQTKEAIKAFQKANGLKADGSVGKQTWELLGAYLEKKEK